MKTLIGVASILTTLTYQNVSLPDVRVRALYCAYGGIGIRPVPLPPGFETEFAVAVVEIEARNEVSGATVTDFTLIGDAGTTAKLKRVVEVEVFERPRVATEGEMAHYLNPGGTRPWDGKLPAGKTRLRIRVAINEQLRPANRFRLTFGGQVIEGPLNGRWPT